MMRVKGSHAFFVSTSRAFSAKIFYDLHSYGKSSFIDRTSIALRFRMSFDFFIFVFSTTNFTCTHKQM